MSCIENITISAFSIHSGWVVTRHFLLVLFSQFDIKGSDPKDHPSYWEQGVNSGFEQFYNGLDPENKRRYMHLCLNL